MLLSDRRRPGSTVAASIAGGVVVAVLFVGACGPGGGAPAADQTVTSRHPAGAAAGTAAARPARVRHPAQAAPRKVVARPAAPATAKVGYGFLAVTSSRVAFLQLSVAGGKIAGWEFEDTVSGAPPNQVIQQRTTRLAGTMAPTRVALVLPGAAAPLLGQVAGTALRLGGPLGGGGGELTYNRATSAQYDQALAVLEAAVKQGNAAALVPTSVADAQQQRQQQERQLIDQAALTVAGDVKDLTVEGPGTISDDLGDLDNDLAAVSNDLGVAEDDYEAVGAGTNACTAVGLLEQDARATVSNGSVLVNDAHDELLPDIASLVRSMAAAQADWAAYWQQQAALPGYPPIDTVPPLVATLAAARAFVTGAVNEANADIDQANRIVQGSYALAGRATQKAKCGRPPSVPVPWPHIAAPQ